MSGFQFYGAKVSSVSAEEMKQKFNEMNAYVVDSVGLERAKTLIGVVSAIVDLGSQPLPDSEYVLEGEDANLSVAQLNEKYADVVKPVSEGGRGVYFAEGYNGQTKQRELMKKVPNKPFQCVAFAVDFPSKIVDKGQFFGESNPQPLRIWYGGKYYDGEKMVIQNLTSLKEKPLTDGGKDWSLNPKSILHKMAVASELVADTKSVFKPERIDELLGKAFLFSVQVGFEQGKGKNAGQQFYREKVSFVGALMDGQEAPVLEKTNLVMMNDPNNAPQAIKEIPAHIKNTIARSAEYEKSVLKTQIEVNGSVGDGEESTQTSTETETGSESKASSGSTDW